MGSLTESLHTLILHPIHHISRSSPLPHHSRVSYLNRVDLLVCDWPAALACCFFVSYFLSRFNVFLLWGQCLAGYTLTCPDGLYFHVHYHVSHSIYSSLFLISVYNHFYKGHTLEISHTVKFQAFFAIQLLWFLGGTLVGSRAQSQNSYKTCSR